MDTWDFVCRDYLPSCRHRFAQWRAHTEGWGAQTLLHFSQIFIHTGQNISSRRDGRKRLPQALLSTSWSSGALPHYIQCKRQLSRPLKWKLWTRDSDYLQIREETESPHLMNSRHKSLPSPLENYGYGSEIFPFSSQNKFTLQSPNNWSCIWKACLLFYLSKSVILRTMLFLLLLLPPSQRAGWEADLPPPPPQLD